MEMEMERCVDENVNVRILCDLKHMSGSYRNTRWYAFMSPA
jgi:hypothetical protein